MMEYLLLVGLGAVAYFYVAYPDFRTRVNNTVKSLFGKSTPPTPPTAA